MLHSVATDTFDSTDHPRWGVVGKPFFVWHNSTPMHVNTHLRPKYQDMVAEKFSWRDGDYSAVRYGKWKIQFTQQPARGSFEVWNKTFSSNSAPVMTDLRAEVGSNLHVLAEWQEKVGWGSTNLLTFRKRRSPVTLALKRKLREGRRAVSTYDLLTP